MALNGQCSKDTAKDPVQPVELPQKYHVIGKMVFLQLEVR